MNQNDIVNFYKTEIKTISNGTMSNYLTHIRKINVSVEQLRAMDDSNLVSLLNSLIKDCPERTRVICRSAYINLLILLNRSHVQLKIYKYKQPLRKVARKYLSWAEVKACVTTASTLKTKLLIMLQYDCGARISEILGITTDSITTTQISKPRQQDVYVTLRQTKNDIIRSVILSPETLKILEQYIDREYTQNSRKLLFVDTYIHVWLHQKHIFEIVFKSDTTFKVSSHWFRSSRVVHLIQAGHSIDTVSQLTGMSAQTVSIYARMSGIESKKVQELTPVDW